MILHGISSLEPAPTVWKPKSGSKDVNFVLVIKQVVISCSRSLKAIRSEILSEGKGDSFHISKDGQKWAAAFLVMTNKTMPFRAFKRNDNDC